MMAPSPTSTAETRESASPGRVPWPAIGAWLATALCLAALALIVLELTTPRLAGSGPAGPPVPRAVFERAWTTRPTALLGMGDGIGASASVLRLLERNDDARYPEMAGMELARAFPDLRRLPSGSATAPLPGAQGLIVLAVDHAELLQPPADGAPRPREGAAYGASLAQARWWAPRLHRRVKHAVGDAKARFAGEAHVFLATIPDPTDGIGDVEAAGWPPWPGLAEALAIYNRALAGVAAADERVHLVDLHALFLGHGLHARDRGHPAFDREDPHPWCEDDWLTPNARGEDAIRRAILLEMARVLAPSQAEPDAP